MLDVIHVFFEEDQLPSWEQDVEIKSQVRQTLYRQLYGEEYKYGFSSSQGRSAEWGTGETHSIYDEPPPGQIKPYIPPSTEEELAAIIGPPMGE